MRATVTDTPISEAIMRVAKTILKNPANPPAEIAYLSVLFTHVAWNETLGLNAPQSFLDMLHRFETANPSVWKQLKSQSVESALADLSSAKKELYPNDCREILKCQLTPEGKVKAEWRMVGSS
jgi:hypothetical protein